MSREERLQNFLQLVEQRLEVVGAADVPEPEACTICLGYGWVLPDVAPDDLRRNKPLACPACDAGREIERRQWERLFSESQIPSRYRMLDFSTWEALDEDAKHGKRLGYAMVRLFVQNQGHYASLRQGYRWWGRDHVDDEMRNWLVLQGNYGTGKTALATAAAINIAQVGESVLFLRMDDYIRAVQATYAREAEHDTDTVIGSAQRAGVLVLDDVNMSQSTANRREILEAVLRYRYNHELPTLLTLNQTPGEFEQAWGERTSSVVMHAAHWIHVAGPSLRQERTPVGGW